MKIRVIALHDLVYSDRQLENFFDFLNSYFHLVNLKDFKSGYFKPCILLTADDGYDDWKKFIPIVEKYNFSLMLGVCTSFIDPLISYSKKTAILTENLHRSKRGVIPISVGTFQELSSHKNVIIADHSYDHIDFGSSDVSVLEAQIQKSQDVFNVYNINVNDFIFPFGQRHNVPHYHDIENILKEYGYTRGWGFYRRFPPRRFLLPRTGIDPSMPKIEIIARISRARAISVDWMHE
ncbi:polysaccharide deacetylase family protein [Roseobacter sp. HKCCA0882]|uniref:polysaccharide deacetylase family protein n=1 Tax=Roseobacter sp. HKCCA0882 TaxID=3120337 RepID=UPI0030ED8F9F